MELARRLDGEIICADSQTVRRGLNIGTAKPTTAAQEEIAHHLLDVIEPYESFSVAQFKQLASAAVEDVLSRGRVPIVVGGTGLYIDALYFDFRLDNSQQKDKDLLDQKSVAELQEIITKNGYQMPENHQNPRHLVGTILRKGKYHSDSEPIPGALIYGLRFDDDALKDRIKKRVNQMFDDGFVDEVRSVIARYGKPPSKLDAIGYPIVMQLLSGEIDEDEAKQLFATADWQYARRQRAWFKRNKHIVWLNTGPGAVEAIIKDAKSA